MVVDLSVGSVLHWLLLALLAVNLGIATAEAQNKKGCVVLCTPEFNLEPTVTFTNLFSRPILAKLKNGKPAETAKLDREVEFELILALGVPTEIPRIGLTLETISKPFADENELELEFEINLHLLEAGQTGGWLEVHFDTVDQLSPSERPRDKRPYTQKLNFELDTAMAVFNWLPKGNWLRNVELEWSLDYLASGIPKAGDRRSGGKELFLTNASPWSLSMVIVIPIAPLSR